ncbi:NADPH:quinone reductase [Sphingobium jiangsuense]|uniref:NADPH:quinone reductase-like Zn-dependent oxidoreductase n=1 Tax=Sphingobium jiangsuense TaxID=870476 RepID=A0A7W6BF76_9SPHN|nr:NADP-dependent oxidoreductase [Sphingobium jiangsuense]MBB3925861.1 NADPH:quinone reductase-like Zn-dependent oxidoreductase [Sphingobium jiangsuense]GLS98714.1 NADPH:quinone reductase [Sphingobium jiangsuense]
MQAILIEDYGDPSILKPTAVPMPDIRPGEVLVRVHAAAVNPADVKWRAGLFASFAPISFPHILGYDIAGEVIGGAGFAPGTRVFGMLDPIRKGGYADYAVLPADQAAPIPDGLDYPTAAAIPTAGLTGLQLVEALAPAPGQLVLLTGTLGSVGRFALHELKRAGARVVAAVRAAQCGEALQLGADEALIVGEQDWPGPAFDHVIDTVGGEEVGRLCRRLHPGGRLLTVATTPIPPQGLPAAPEFFSVRPDGGQCAHLAAIVAAGAIEVPVARQLPLRDAAQAHHLVEQGGLGGKVVLIP